MSAAAQTAVFRADASVAIGGGHVRRCLALADALAALGWRCVFAVAAETTATVSALATSGHRVVRLDHSDEAAALNRALPEGCRLMVTDHYSRDARLERACRGWAQRIAAIDDLADRAHECDWLIDQSTGRAPRDYEDLVPQTCTVLAGPAYALLNRRFHAARRKSRAARSSVRRLLVSFGTTDAGGATVLALNAVAMGLPRAEVDVICGAANPRLETIALMCRELAPRARLLIDVEDTAAVMAEADVAVGGGGVMALERCCLGIPSVLLILSQNQRANAVALDASGAALVVGDAATADPEAVAAALRSLMSDDDRRRQMAERALAVCDGLGVNRVRAAVHAPQRAKDGAEISLRPAGRADMSLMLEWQRAPGARQFARDQAPPEPEAHRRWLETKLGDPGCVFNIVLHDGEPAGVLRYDPLHGERYEVSLLIAKERQGRGLGGAALRLGSVMLAESEIVADIHPENQASLSAFANAEYLRESERIWRRPPLAVSTSPTTIPDLAQADR